MTDHDDDEDSPGDVEAGTLRGLNPVTIYSRERVAGQTRQPHWLTEGQAVLSPRAPAEVHGIADGVSLKHASVLPAAPADSVAMPTASGYPARLRAARHRDEGGNTTYFFPDLILDDVGDWRLCQQVEEKSVYGELNPLVPPEKLAIAERMSTPAAPSTRGNRAGFAIPVIDSSYALANLSGRGRVKVDRRGAPEAVVGHHPIVDKGGDWLNAGDAQMSGRRPGAFNLPALTEFTHTAGFGAKPPRAQPYREVLGRSAGLRRDRRGNQATRCPADREPTEHNQSRRDLGRGRR